MNINATLIGQSITFLIFVWFCMKYIWPPIMGALETRKKMIADGLAAADRAKLDLELAKKKATENLHEAKTQAAEIIAQAEKRSAQIVEDAKIAAKVEGERQFAAAQASIEQLQGKVPTEFKAQKKKKG